MPDRESFDAWLQIHQALIAKELEFTRLAVTAASDPDHRELLDRERGELMALRERCSVAYKKAFPVSVSH